MLRKWAEFAHKVQWIPPLKRQNVFTEFSTKWCLTLTKKNQTGQPFNWQITVIKSKELNAWAMPGGKMAFYTGLVDSLRLNDDEIATIMGHEMATCPKGAR